MRTLGAVVGTVALVGAGFALGQAPPPYGASINLDSARKAMSAAVAEAKKNNWSVAIAIVDTGGHLLAFGRLDNTQSASADIAISKATTANSFRRPTKALEDAVAGGRTVLLAVEDIMPLEGGLPIIVDGKIVGGIGVSGVLSSQDAMVAKVGADAAAAK